MPWQSDARLSGCYFYHTMELPGFGLVHGEWHIRDFQQYTGSVDLSGKRVLDVGTASGFLSFAAERAGATEVVSFDLDSAARMCRLPFAGNPFWTNREKWLVDNQTMIDGMKAGYHLAHRLLNSKAQPRYGDIFELRNLEGAPFDVTVAGAFLEHINDPVSALANLAMATKELLVIAFTEIADTDEPILRAGTDMATPGSDFTWWIASVGVYRRVLKNMGFTIEAIKPSTAYFELECRTAERSTLVARRQSDHSL